MRKNHRPVMRPRNRRYYRQLWRCFDSTFRDEGKVEVLQKTAGAG